MPANSTLAYRLAATTNLPPPPAAEQREPEPNAEAAWVPDGEQARPGLPSPEVDMAAARAVQPWAIHPGALPLSVTMQNPHMNPDAAHPTAALEEEYDTPVAVLRCDGVILPRLSPGRARWLAGYAVGAENLAAAVQGAASTANAVMVCFDSPGGSVAGVAEAAAQIAAVAARKPVVAVADHVAASAAYYLASACSAVVASPSALVGSVGVISVRPSYARALEDDGIDVSVFTRGAGKTDRAWFVAVSDDAAERLDTEVGDYYDQFVSAVARGRGVPPRTVRTEWGARVLTAERARAAGMTDLTATAAATLAMLSTPRGRQRFRTMAAARSIVTASAERERHDA